MKTKHSIFRSIVAICFAIFIISGCKKKEEEAPAPTPVPTTDGSTQQSQRASDQSSFENETNQAMDDANSALQGVSTTRGVQVYCNMTIDSSQKAIGKLTLNFNGLDCSGMKNRTGAIVIQLPYNGSTVTTWSTAGATASLTFNNYTVTYVSNNKSIIFNGTHSVTNVNGGGWLTLYLGTPIVHKVRADMQLTFDDGTTRIWKAAKKRTLTYIGGVLKVTMAGDTVIGSYNNVAFWGVNRMGENFTVDVPTAFSYDMVNPGTNCTYKPLTGVIVHYGVAHVLTLTYGVDTNGNSVTPGTCPYGYKISWVDGQGATQQAVLSY